MSKFTRVAHDLKEEPKEVREMQVTNLDGTSEIMVQVFEPGKIQRPGDGDYRVVKAKYGSLAMTDEDRPNRSQRDARFSINPLLRDPLSIEAEEQRAIESRINAAVKELSDAARLEAQKRGYDEGYARGRGEAMQVFKKEGEERLAQIEALLKGFSAVREEIFAANERFLIELVFRMAKRVALKEIQADPDYLLKLARTLLERLDLSDNVAILIHPQDRESLIRIREGLAKELSGVKNLHIEVSSKVPRGGIQVETDWGVLGASIEGQLEAIEKAVVENAGQGNAG